MSSVHNFKAIAFDYGGVIELNDNKDILGQIAAALNVPDGEFRKTYFENNHLANVNNMKWEDMIVEIARMFNKAPEAEHRTRELVQEHNAGRKINSAITSLFPELKKAGLKVAILSNATAELRRVLTANGIAQSVDEVILSGEVGFQKPHKEIFEILFKKVGAKPEEVIFIDDSPTSLAKAHEIGYIPILFKDTKQAITELKNLGVLAK